MKLKRIKRILIFILASLFCLLPLSVFAEESQEAKNLTSKCTIEYGKYPHAKTRVTDSKLKTYQIFDPGARIKIQWTDSIPARYLCMQWFQFPEDVSLRLFDQDGSELFFSVLESTPETVITLPETVRSAVIEAGDKEMKLSKLAVYGEGELPDPFHKWEDLPDKLDFLVIATHPDDDVLYLGSVVPIYGAERGYAGTVVYVTCGTRERRTEAENGAWAMGQRYTPVFLGFPDIEPSASAQKKAGFVYEDVVRAIVRLYRQYRPPVVFAQDEKGEYGHWQHKLTSQASVEAFTLAADPEYDPESVETYGTWQVQKVYLHLYKENKLVLDANSPLESFGGKDAWNVARAAYKKHESQQRYGFAVERNKGNYPFNVFGMRAGVVEAGDDAFDNVSETLLSSYVPPTPSPTPVPTDTPSPTPAPTDTPAPTFTPSPEPTTVPTEAPALISSSVTTQKPAEEPSIEPGPSPVPEPGSFRLSVPVIILIAAGGVLAAALIILGIRLMKKNRNT